ncbi:hypothetical protein PVAP13_2KG195601 [Panicum virgatum]|uniref:Uncharacterized protein n=1 Tax=Panicum virgatum TaxID=38727 RepID=A0A8T0WAT8_PANVG|nr:hypothetical protein PVAP13_2KG195601 [Panicum virgatum]
MGAAAAAGGPLPVALPLSPLSPPPRAPARRAEAGAAHASQPLPWLPASRRRLRLLARSSLPPDAGRASPPTAGGRASLRAAAPSSPTLAAKFAGVRHATREGGTDQTSLVENAVKPPPNHARSAPIAMIRAPFRTAHAGIQDAGELQLVLNSETNGAHGCHRPRLDQASHGGGSLCLASTRRMKLRGRQVGPAGLPKAGRPRDCGTWHRPFGGRSGWPPKVVFKLHWLHVDS